MMAPEMRAMGRRERKERGKVRRRERQQRNMLLEKKTGCGSDQVCGQESFCFGKPVTEVKVAGGATGVLAGGR